MNDYKNYINVLRCILKNFNDHRFDDIIENILIKIFGDYYLERDIKKYNIDNTFKKYNINMYNLLSKKYKMTKSNKLIFIKHIYNKNEYIIKLLKKDKNFRLDENETYKSVSDKILESDANIDCYTKFVNNFCYDRSSKFKFCYHPPCYHKILNSNYCNIHQDKNLRKFKNSYKNKVYTYSIWIII